MIHLSRWKPSGSSELNLISQGTYCDIGPAILIQYLWGETQETVGVTYSELYHQVARLSPALREQGVNQGDRVVGLISDIVSCKKVVELMVKEVREALADTLKITEF